MAKGPGGAVETRLADDPPEVVVRGAMKEGWQSDIWRVTRFVAYPTFVSLEQIERSERHVEQVVVSIDSRGEGYRIRFLLDAP